MKKYENFCRSLENLREIYRYDEPYDNVVMTGLVGLFEICFEQSWKAMKETLEAQGYPESQTGSPRQILKTAYYAGMLKNQSLWLAALAARNNVTHAYNRGVALDIIRQTKDDFYPLFIELKAEIDGHWLEVTVQSPG